MNSYRLTSKLRQSREILQQLSLDSYMELGLSPPNLSTSIDVEFMRQYLGSNPDNTLEQLAELIAQVESGAELPLNVVDLTTPPARSILSERVRQIEGALEGLDPGRHFERTCFGTTPGGGLDATSFRVDGSNEYAVVVPQGFFHLTNLMTKLVILLHPITQSAEGPLFASSASFEQIGLAKHPYVVFRHRDLLEAFFLWGNPLETLSYTRAVPYQDRFAYLLVGTELFVLAHELAHILLGHFDGPEIHDAESIELEADTLALKIVSAYFRSKTDYPLARASLCGLLFLSMIKMWETGLERLTGDPMIARSHTHPVSSARFERFTSLLQETDEDETPSWYILTGNAIGYLTTDFMLFDALHHIKEMAKYSDGISCAVLPRAYLHLGHFNSPNTNRKWLKLAHMLISEDDGQQRLGLWLFVNHLPNSAISLYKGINDEDVEVQKSCEAALISIQPIYSAYIPRLRERYRETAEEEEFDDYLIHLSGYLGAMASAKLGDFEKLDPMDPHFFLLAGGEDE